MGGEGAFCDKDGRREVKTEITFVWIEAITPSETKANWYLDRQNLQKAEPKQPMKWDITRIGKNGRKDGKRVKKRGAFC